MDGSPISAARWLLNPPVGILGTLRRFLTALVLVAAAANAGDPPPADVAPPHGPRPDRSPVEIGRPDLGAKGTASVGARTPVEGGSPLDRPCDGHHEDRPGSRGRSDGDVDALDYLLTPDGLPTSWQHRINEGPAKDP